MNDNDLADYIAYVRSLWIPSKEPPTYTSELVACMIEAGFIIDKVVTLISKSGESKVWYGTCYNENLEDFTFKATWTFSNELFTQSAPHIYELTDIEIEPVGRLG